MCFGGCFELYLFEKTKLWNICVFKKKKNFGVPHLATFIFVISIVMCNSQHRLHPSSIRCRGLNSQPLDHEWSSAFTTRPWLLVKHMCFIKLKKLTLTKIMLNWFVKLFPKLYLNSN